MAKAKLDRTAEWFGVERTCQECGKTIASGNGVIVVSPPWAGGDGGGAFHRKCLPERYVDDVRSPCQTCGRSL